MSAFVVSDDHINAMLTAGIEQVDFGPLRWLAPEEQPADTHERGQPWGPEAIEDAQRRRRELTRETAGRVGAMLAAENVASVNHRYDEHDTEEPYVYRRYQKPLKPIAVIKLARCYRYQSCEHPEWDCSEAKAFCDALIAAMVGRIPGYDESPWTI